MEEISKFFLTEEEKDKFIDALTPELALLRAKAEISQEEIANIAGLSRNTVGSIIKKLKQNDFIHSVEGKTKRYFLDKKTTKFIKELNNIKEYN